MPDVDKLAGVADRNGLASVVEGWLSEIGFDGFIFITNARETLCSRPAGPLLESYNEHAYNLVDPVQAELRGSRLPVVWDAEQHRRQCRGKRARMFEETLDAGYTRGISVPVWGPEGASDTLVGLTSLPRSDFFQVSKHVSHEMMVMAAYLASEFHEPVTEDPIEPVQLTKRERQCIQWTACGKTAWEVGKILGISRATVNFHVQNACRKFGVHTKAQAAVLAAQIGLIDGAREPRHAD